jgi:hypothetical protein
VSETPTDDQFGFRAKEPELCHDCYRLFGAGERCFLTIMKAGLC